MNDSEPHQRDLIHRAVAGDPPAFAALIQEHRSKLRGVVRRMIGHPEDTDDVVQESILRAWEAVRTYRGEAGFGTWLCAIGIRQAVDHLRKRKSWRVEAQVVYANECGRSDALRNEVMAVLADPASTYDAREHIAYCFTCVGRSLPPEEQAALVAREILGMSAREAAAAFDVTESVVRHRLRAARAEMERRYEGLCALVNKGGVCYQCSGLRDVAPPSQRGPDVPTVGNFDDRCRVAREADIDGGASQAMHDLFWRRIRELEDSGRGSAVAESDCGLS